jgi:hypothetical protein
MGKALCTVKRMTTTRKRFALGAVSLLLGFALWLPLVHLFFAPGPDARDERARLLLAAQVRLWTEPALRAREVERMRAANNEWDFMGRTFLVWSLGELALRDPSSRVKNVEIMDRIIEETIAVEREKGLHFFLMSSQLGAFYLLFYFAFVLVAPTLVLGAGIFAVLERLTREEGGTHV